MLLNAKNVDCLHILNFDRSLVHEVGEETLEHIASEVYGEVPSNLVFALVSHYMNTTYVYCVDKDGLLFPPMEGKRRVKTSYFFYISFTYSLRFSGLVLG